MLGVIGSRCLRMRIHISHLTSYCYETPAAGVIQMLRLTPRNHDGQYVARWHIGVSTDCRLDQHKDAFGNITHVFTADGPLNELAIAVEGEVETRDTQGIVRGTVERFPPSLYLRETALTTADANIAALAAASRDAGRTSALDHLHRMLRRLHEDMLHDNAPRHTAIAAAEAFARKRGVGQDFAHVFIAAARSLGIPARYVGGYFRNVTLKSLGFLASFGSGPRTDLETAVQHAEGAGGMCGKSGCSLRSCSALCISSV
jgi:transglutaminase-like putative cysteine protease